MAVAWRPTSINGRNKGIRETEDLKTSVEGIENALCEMDEVDFEKMAFIEDMLCEIEMGGEKMNRIWANRLVAGTKTWEQCVKVGRAAEVEDILREQVHSGSITVEEFKIITGMDFSEKLG